MSDRSDVTLTMSEGLEIYGNPEVEYKMKQKRLDLELIKKKINLRKCNKDAMLESIMLSEPVGLSTDELKNKLGCHRDTIHSIGFELQNEGLTTKDGKFGKYHLTQRSLLDPEVSASFLGAKIMRDFYGLGQEPISIKNIFCNQSLCKVALIVDDSEPKQGLLVKINFFEFALRLGAIITYQIIQSMRYCQQDAPGSSFVHKTTNKLRDENMSKYIQNVMNPSSMIFAFRDLYSVDKRLKEHKSIETICTHKVIRNYMKID